MSQYAKSIHLQPFPDHSAIPCNDAILKSMDMVRDICSTGLGLRKLHNIRVRLPLNSITVYSHHVSDHDLSNFSEIISDEINIKSIFYDELSSVTVEKLTLNFKNCGSKFGRDVPQITRAINCNDFLKSNDDTILVSQKYLLSKDDYTVIFDLKERRTDIKMCSNHKIAVFLDTTITYDLQSEGIARDIIRLIQQSRKSMDLEMTQKVGIKISSESESVIDVLLNSKWREYIAHQTLADLDLFGYISSDILEKLDCHHCYEYNTDDYGNLSVVFTS